ncbi:hypothetical protein B5X24_HaOG207839 [Helicoverpa armigera]|uniref:Uncharacterized protein n=1 Tax=Helicoverpa armigera TaxID=29058 RepID=A0A2W1BNJ2_HELAM|nr:hypothetical protein B5X24_HaOG207839 [Helicoverpa armigera]
MLKHPFQDKSTKESACGEFGSAAETGRQPGRVPRARAGGDGTFALMTHIRARRRTARRALCRISFYILRLNGNGHYLR